MRKIQNNIWINRKQLSVTIVLCMLLPGATRAIDRIELTGADATVWQPPTGEWRIIGEVSVNPRNTKLLTTRPGTGIIINGRMGKTVPIVSKQEFADVRAHFEFMIPQGSNSGIYFQGQRPQLECE